MPGADAAAALAAFASLSEWTCPFGDGLDAVHPRGGADRRELLHVGRHGAGEGYRPVLDGDADSIRIGHLRVPPQLLDDFFPDLAVGFHRLPL